MASSSCLGFKTIPRNVPRGNPVVCTASDQCHDVGTCNTSTGVCSNPPKANGTACSDGNSCTQTDTCQAGTCTGGNPVVCTASDQCHAAGQPGARTGTGGAGGEASRLDRMQPAGVDLGEQFGEQRGLRLRVTSQPAEPLTSISSSSSPRTTRSACSSS